MVLTGRRGLAAALIVSLAANAALVGYGLGERLAERRWQAAGPSAGETAPLGAATDRLLSDMPPSTRRAFRAALLDRLPEIRERADVLRARRAAVAGLLGAPTVDEAALAEALADLRVETAALQATLHAIVAEVAPDLPPDDRRAFAERWEELPRALPADGGN